MPYLTFQHAYNDMLLITLNLLFDIFIHQMKKHTCTQKRNFLQQMKNILKYKTEYFFYIKLILKINIAYFKT